MSYREDLIKQLNSIPGEPSHADLQKVTAKFFKEGLWVSTLGRKVFAWAIALAVISIVLICIPFNCTASKMLHIIIYAGWSIFPPAWFMYEYTWKFPDELKFDSMQFNDLKYKQELGAKIWAGMVILITAMMVYKYGIKF